MRQEACWKAKVFADYAAKARMSVDEATPTFCDDQMLLTGTWGVQNDIPGKHCVGNLNKA